MLAYKFYTFARTSLVLLPWLVHLLFSDILLSLLLPLSLLAPTLTYNASSHIAYAVWLGIQNIFTSTNRAHITISGLDALPDHESAVVIANHVQWADFYMIQELALQAGMLSRCRWFAKQQLKWVPFLGWGLWAMGMPLVTRRWTEDQREMDRVFHGVLQRQWPMCMFPLSSTATDAQTLILPGLISYSEATRYTPHKRLEAEAWCRQHSKQLGKHLLYPRTKGFIACVQKLRNAEHVRAVYDVTIAYAERADESGKNWVFQSPPSFGQTVLEPRLDTRWKFHVRVQRHALDDLPRHDDELASWLENRWVEKGDRLEALKQALEDGRSWEEPMD